MEKKNLYLGLGVVALAGLGIYLYNKNKETGTTTTTPQKTSGADGDDDNDSNDSNESCGEENSGYISPFKNPVNKPVASAVGGQKVVGSGFFQPTAYVSPYGADGGNGFYYGTLRKYGFSNAVGHTQDLKWNGVVPSFSKAIKTQNGVLVKWKDKDGNTWTK